MKKYDKIRSTLFIPETAYTDQEIAEIDTDVGMRLANVELKDLLIMYEISRRIGDSDLIKYFSKRIEGILGL